jgi:transporter family-2 protein
MLLRFDLKEAVMQLIFILLVIAGGMGLSVEAGLLGPLGQQVGDLWATFSIFGVGAALTFLLMLFFSPRNSPSFFAQPGWQLLGGILGPGYVVILTLATPVIGIAMTMIGILAGQVFKSLVIDHFGLLGTPHRRIDGKRIIALVFIIIALALVARG